MALTNKLINIANAIREKTGKSNPLTLDSMVEAIESISAGGGDEQSVLDSLIDKSITEVRSNATKVGDHAFYNCTALTSVDFPLATSIGSYAFQYCSKLTSANFPLVSTIGSDAFYNCRLTSADFPLATTIGTNAFQNCTGLISVNFPLATSIGNSAFYSCHSLPSVDFPSVLSIGKQAFYGCNMLTSANFPLATTIGNYAFYSCGELTSVDFSSVTNITDYAFLDCYSLVKLVLRNDTICTLSNSSVFNKCYHLHGTVHAVYNSTGLKDGYIYVPRALLSDDDATKDYRRATNWSEFATQFRALEDYTVDGTTTGALDESKI